MYNQMHETFRIQSAVGGASPAGSPLAEKTDQSVGSSSSSWRASEFGFALERHFSAQGLGRIAFPSQYGSSALVEPDPEKEAGKGSASRSPVLGLLHRLVDIKAHRASDCQEISCLLSSLSYLAPASGDGLELSEAGKARQGKKRESDCALEKGGLATYKKTPKNLDSLWFSWMRVGFSWFRAFGAPGLRREKHLPCAVRVTGRRFLLSLRSGFLLKESALRSTSAFILTEISVLLKRFVSSKFFFSISPEVFSSSGIEAEFTGRSWFKTSLKSILKFIGIISQRMLRSSIRWSLSGTISNALRRMEFPKTIKNFALFCIPRCKGCVATRNCSGPASMRLSCRGNKMLHYLCKSQ